MSTHPQVAPNCKDCGILLAPGSLVCGNCHTLVHKQELERLSAVAQALESKGQLREAHARWMDAFFLLPGRSQQADWIKNHADDLRRRADALQLPDRQADSQAKSQPPSWAKRLGPLAPLAILLSKAKFLFTALFKLKFLLSFASFIGLYWALYGPKFGIGFAVLILIHEMGHFIDVKRRGLPAEMPVFLPGFGAYVRWQALGVSLETRAAVSLAGPLAGLLAAMACLAVWTQTADPVWAALARAGAWLNIVNLVPVWVLDGGSAANALSREQRLILAVAALAMAVFLGEGLLYFVAAGAAYRLFTHDFPPQPSLMITGYFLAVLGLLGMVLWMTPGYGVAR